jgi:CheY-like chemotaxis protein
MQDVTVLVVEDEPAVRSIVVEMLQEIGCRVIEAEDGGKGAAILASDIEIDLLVTDIGLPVLNGRQVATVARSSRPDLPILFMTGYAENAAITEGFGERTTLVTKPFRPAQIADAVGRMLA